MVDKLVKKTDDFSVHNAQIISQFTKGLFWGFNKEKLDYIRHRDMIIERVIEAGLENDEILMCKLYGYDDIKNVAINMENLEEEKIIYMSFLLHIEKEEFKCYGKKMWYQK